MDTYALLKPLTCDIADPQFLLFNDIPSLVYISHIPIFVIAFLLGFFVFWSNRGRLENRVFFGAMFFFGGWVFLDSVFWAANRPDIIMLVWTIIVLIEPLVHMSLLYLAYILVTGRDMPFSRKLIAALLFLPQLIIVPTTLTLSSFDIANCIPNEAPLAYYSYIIETIFIFWLTVLAMIKLRTVKDARKHRELVYVMTGAVAFLVSFTGGNIYGSITDNWNVGAIGLFGMILLAAFFAYSIVKYQTFNVKLISTQALVAALVLMSAAQIFLAKTYSNRILTIITFVLMLTLGMFLVRAVRFEVKRKEELQEISDRLAVANTELRRLDNAKSEFISIASHQLRTPLTAIKGFVSLLLEGAYGRLEPAVGDTLNKVYLANNRLMSLVENLLNISRIEAGRIQYQFAPTKLEDILSELRDIFVLAAHEKGLKLGIELPKEPLPLLSIDGPKIREVVSNVIDNSIKYTETGGITVTAEKRGREVLIIVTDTGVGIDSEDLPHLFQKFERGKDAAQVNVSSTGLGLYVGKSFIEAHQGTIRAESAGKGKGSRFIMTLPLDRDNLDK